MSANLAMKAHIHIHTAKQNNVEQKYGTSIDRDKCVCVCILKKISRPYSYNIFPLPEKIKIKIKQANGDRLVNLNHKVRFP